MNRVKKFTFVTSKDFKKVLIEYRQPIITGIHLPESFELDSDEEIDGTSSLGGKAPDYDDPIISKNKGHCILVYGWDSEHYLAKNSWSEMPYLRVPFKYNQFLDSWVILE